MKNPVWSIASMAVVVVVAALLRLADLDVRPMHNDEANQALKFGRLLDQGRYEYDPHEHHGPSLYYLTLPIAWLDSARKLTGITETHLRLLPAVFGIVLVGLVWLLREELGRGAALAAAALTAVSPAMVFYSRYYIQEMLLVCFTFAAVVALWRFRRTAGEVLPEGSGGKDRWWLRATPWLVLLGLSVGMMHASKETCVVAFLAMAAAAALTMYDVRQIGIMRLVLACLIVLIVASGVSVLFFSSFFDNPRGVVDSLATYGHYLGRASGEGSAGEHDYPWYHYFRILFWWHQTGGPVWTEASIAALGLVGLAAAALGKGLGRTEVAVARFFGVYTLIMTAIYSAVPYKTPWCALGLLHGMILLAGIGAAVLIRLLPGLALKGAGVALLLAAIGHLGWQSYRASFTACEDRGNPYAYVPTTSDALTLVRGAGQLAAVHPDGKGMYVQVICPNDDYWPLPWYLRDFTRLGFDRRVPDWSPAPLIITQPPLEAAVNEYLYVGQPREPRCAYVCVLPKEKDGDLELRPNVPLRVYVRADLWERYAANEDLDSPHVFDRVAGDLPQLAERLRHLAAVHPDGAAMPIQVICADHDYWPLPWHLREFQHVDWLGGMPDGRPAPLVITRPELEPALADYLYVKQPPGKRNLYVPVPPEQEDRDWQLRPHVPLRVYARLDLWEEYSQRSTEEALPENGRPESRQGP